MLKSNNKVRNTALMGLFSMLAICINSGASAKQVTGNKYDNNEEERVEITVLQKSDQSSRIYQVNGKQFAWHDLSESQKKLLTNIEQDLDTAEGQLRAHEKALVEHEKRLQKQLALLEASEKTRIEKLDEKASALAEVLRQKEIKLRTIEEQFAKIESEELAAIEKRSRKLEKVLVEIANQIGE